MAQSYRIETCVFRDGERFPLLICSNTGMPDFYSTVYTAAVLRRRLAPNSILANLRAIMLLHAIGDRLRLNIEDCIFSGGMLTLAEVEQLSTDVRKPMSDIRKCDVSSGVAREGLSADDKVSLIRRSLSKTTTRRRPKQVSGEFAGARLLYIHAYLKWLTDLSLARIDQASERYRTCKENADRMLLAIHARTKERQGRYGKKPKLGLSDEARAVLLEIIIPDSPRNPWVRRHTAFRNFLMILLLLTLGIRRGELLAIKTKDVKYLERSIEIVRRHDDPEDPRANQPTPKTDARKLPLGDVLLDLLATYVTDVRKKISGAKRHPFLFVAEYTGAPLGLEAVNLLFRDLQRCDPLLAELVPHMLRHTYNYDLGDKADKGGWAEAEEDKIRKYLNGWSPRSMMVDHYNQRRIREKAAKASLSLQEDMPAIKRPTHKRDGVSK